MPTPEKEYTILQIMVLCGTREEKHTKILQRETGLSEKAISAWSSRRGVPYRFWDMVCKMAGVSRQELAAAQAALKGNTTAHDELELYDREQERVDKGAA